MPKDDEVKQNRQPDPFTSGMFQNLEPEEVYPIGDAEKAVRNAMRSQGRWFDPWNRTTAPYLKWLAAAAMMNFVNKMVGTGGETGADFRPGREFGGYLESIARRESSPFFGMGTARAGLQGVNDLVRRWKEATRNLDTGQASAFPQFSEPQKWIAGMFGGPEAQSKLYQAAYGAAAPGMMEGIMRAMAPLEQIFEDYLEARGKEQPFNFLDLLLGGNIPALLDRGGPPQARAEGLLGGTSMGGQLPPTASGLLAPTGAPARTFGAGGISNLQRMMNPGRVGSGPYTSFLELMSNPRMVW